MNWPTSLFISFLTGLFGLFLGGLIGLACVKWFRISSFEGASGYAVVGIALCGGVLAVIIGLVAARWGAGEVNPGFLKAFVRAWGAALVVALLIVTICRVLAGPQQEKTFPQTAVEAGSGETTFMLPSPEAPLEDWISLIQYGAPEERMAAIVRAVEARPAFPDEAKALAFGDDHRIAGTTLSIIANFENTSPDLIPVLISVGDDLAKRFRYVNALTTEEDPSFQAAADVSLRFFGWISAARTLRASGKGDFVPELRTLFELAQVRSDSMVMRNDISRVSGQYLNEWTTLPEP